jgi:hypothetical protein
VSGANESDTSAHLWDGWTDWAEDHHEFVGTQRRFSDRLQDKGFIPEKSGKSNIRTFRGIRCTRENRKKQAAETRKRADEARAAQEAAAKDQNSAPPFDPDDIPF